MKNKPREKNNNQYKKNNVNNQRKIINNPHLSQELNVGVVPSLAAGDLAGAPQLYPGDRQDGPVGKPKPNYYKCEILFHPKFCLFFRIF